MNARQFMFESDQRTTAQKMLDLIRHPNTEDTVRAVAQTKFDRLMNTMTEAERSQVMSQPISGPARPAAPPPPVPPTRTICNIDSANMDIPYSCYQTVRIIYMCLSGLRPRPSIIYFLHNQQIHMLVPPPFLGISKLQYYNMIWAVQPSIKSINCDFVLAEGSYHFVLSFI
jgi:hypothetical protein